MRTTIELSSDGTIIYNGVDKILHNPILKRGLNKAGELSFVIRPDDDGYNKLFAKISFINVYDIDDSGKKNIKWSGQVDKVERTDSFGTKKITCIGLLALLNNIFACVKRPSKSSVTVQNYMTNVIASHKDSVYMITDKTPITIYAEQEKKQTGTVRIYWEADIGDRRGVLPVHTDGTSTWEYYGTIYRPYFYLICEGNTEPYRIRLRAAAHGIYEIEAENPDTRMWKESYHESTVLDPTKYTVVEKKWMIHDYLFLDLEPGKLYKLRTTSELMQIEPDSTVESSKKIYYPHEVSVGTTLDFMKYLINHKKGFLKAWQDTKSKKIRLSYTETRRKSSQVVQLKRNLIDYNEKYNYENLYTGIIPYIMKDGKAFFLPTNFADKTLFEYLIVSDTLSKIYGPIYRLYQADESYDSSDPDTFFDKILGEAEEEFLAISVKMYDESYIDPEQVRIEIGDIVNIKTIDASLNEVCTEIEEHFNEPEKNVYKFGVSSKKISKYLAEQDPDFLDLSLSEV